MVMENQEGLTSLKIISFLALGALVMVGLLLISHQLDSKTGVGFLGVIIGVGISTATTLLTARENRRHQLRTAALERRLQAHQEAYSLWWNLFGAVHDEQRIGKIVMECQDWWVKNCLYLAPEARRAFSAAYHAAYNHRSLLRPDYQADAARENWRLIQDAGPAILRGVELPSIGEGEYPPLQPPS